MQKAVTTFCQVGGGTSEKSAIFSNNDQCEINSVLHLLHNVDETHCICCTFSDIRNCSKPSQHSIQGCTSENSTKFSDIDMCEIDNIHLQVHHLCIIAEVHCILCTSANNKMCGKYGEVYPLYVMSKKHSILISIKCCWQTASASAIMPCRLG